MLPHLGAGAATGLEDVLLLVRLLSRPETQSSNLTVRRAHPPMCLLTYLICISVWFQAVLETYSNVRRPRAKAVWDASYRAGAVYDHHGPHGPTPEGVVQDLQHMWDPVWRWDLDAEFDAAVALL